jgi:hypothetical protein
VEVLGLRAGDALNTASPDTVKVSNAQAVGGPTIPSNAEALGTWSDGRPRSRGRLIGPEERRIAHVTVLALARVAKGARVHLEEFESSSTPMKADLERELETWVPNCTKCGPDVHWESGLGVTPGTWAHREPAPHGKPSL